MTKFLGFALATFPLLGGVFRQTRRLPRQSARRR